jgi:hypothetical protein
VVLQLQPLLNTCYRCGRYASLDYSRAPRLALDKEDAEWGEGLLVEKGLRQR